MAPVLKRGHGSQPSRENENIGIEVESFRLLGGNARSSLQMVQEQGGDEAVEERFHG